MHFFTDPYKDELIYSAIARYHYYTGNIDCRDTLEELFGKRSIIPSLEIGSNLNALAKNLGSRYTADSIIKNHTIFPFYSPFLPKGRKKELLREIKNEDGNGIYTKIGIIAGSICKKKGIYYCPNCAVKEIQEYGEAYIHREHQLQGVYVCPHDGAELKRYPVDKSNFSRIEFIRLDRKLLDLNNLTLIDNRYYDKLYKISRDAYYLLQANLQNASKDVILNKYKNILYSKGLTTSNKRVKQLDLYEEFISFYGNDFLEKMESSIDNDDEYNWLRVITRDLKRTVHPIRHLLFINFLEQDISKFFKDINKEFAPFGEGPWLCLNSAADHYRQRVVNDLRITEDYKTRVPVGTFTCECGFIYSRKGPDKTEQDRYKIGRIKNFGPVWENKLKGYLKENKYGLREIARLMRCDPKTVLKFDSLFKINYFKNQTKQINHNNKSVCYDKTEEYKQNILEVIQTNPKLSRTEIRKICKKQYEYIYRKDKAWLLNNLPQKVRTDNNKIKVDWNKRDLEILKLIKAKYQEMINEKPSIRITISSIGKRADVLAALEKNIDKLPDTKEYLNKITETVEGFQIRRCKNIIDDKFKNEEEIKLWKLQRIAGIRTNEFKKIEEEILKYIDMKRSNEIYEKSSN